MVTKMSAEVNRAIEQDAVSEVRWAFKRAMRIIGELLPPGSGTEVADVVSVAELILERLDKLRSEE
jgi:hypothetical protein